MNGTRYRLSAVLFLATLAGTMACEVDSTAPGPEGTYTATELSATTTSGTSDLLAAGAELSITLTPAGTTTGTLVVPGAFTESGTEETFSLEGTWDYDEGTGIVTFDHPADTFVRDTEFTLSGNELHGVIVNGPTTVRATLER